jgi:methionyl-tRNA formyltransferase
MFNTAMQLTKTNTIFMGSPLFALPCLHALHKQLNVTHIFTKPDAQKGRGKKLSPTPIKEWGIEHNIPVSTPLTKTDLADMVMKINPTLIIVIAYGMILPKQITDNYTCINLHASLLPQYRGASPIHSSLLNNDKISGVTAIHMNEKMDEGDILHSNDIQIKDTDTLSTLHDTLSQLSAKTILDVLDNKTLSPKKQDHSQASFCKKLHTSDRRIHPSDPTSISYGKIRAFAPKPGAFIEKNGKTIKIIEACLQNESLSPIIVQPEGKGPMPYADYLLGHPEGLSLC